MGRGELQARQAPQLRALFARETTRVDQINYHPIGIIRTPFAEANGVPIQPVGAQGISGAVELDPAYEPCLKDLEGFSHLILLYHFHRAGDWAAEVVPFMDDRPRGVFSTRAPARPNAIGFTVVRLTAVLGSTLHVENVDMLDGTPLLDVKPYVPEFDCWDVERRGWLEGKSLRARELRSDGRFG